MLISFCCRVNVILVTTLFFHFPFGFLQFPGKYDLLFDSFSVEETAVKGRGRKRKEQQVEDALIPCLYFLRLINRQTEREKPAADCSDRSCFIPSLDEVVCVVLMSEDVMEIVIAFSLNSQVSFSFPSTSP